jgi:hypothetical protein
LAGPAAVSVATASAPRSGAIPSVGPSDGGGMPGLFGAPRPGPELVAALRSDAFHYTWAAAVVGSSNAAGYQLGAGVPVMAVGGFNGTDPAPTLQQFQDLVAHGRIHWFVHSTMPGPAFAGRSGSDAAERINDWVSENFSSRIIDRVKVYDLTHVLTGGS